MHRRSSSLCRLFRYNASKLKFTDFHFGSPLMRLLYIHNKTDLAMKLFMDEVRRSSTKADGNFKSHLEFERSLP